MNMKKPWVAALFNIILPGLGYVYVGKRVLFGAGVLFASIVSYWGASFETIPISVWIDSFIVTILFAYDGYKDAQEVNLLQK